MISISLRSLGIGLVIAIAAISSGGSAVALTYDDILGKWCGVSTNPNLTNLLFSRDRLIVFHLANNTQTTLQVDHYEFTDTEVMLYYLAAGTAKTQQGSPGNERVYATYRDFGADGKTMIQVATKYAGQYRFIRC